MAVAPQGRDALSRRRPGDDDARRQRHGDHPRCQRAEPGARGAARGGGAHALRAPECRRRHLGYGLRDRPPAVVGDDRSALRPATGHISRHLRRVHRLRAPRRLDLVAGDVQPGREIGSGLLDAAPRGLARRHRPVAERRRPRTSWRAGRGGPGRRHFDGYHRAADPGTAISAGAEAGGHRAARRRCRPRLQQSSHRHPRLRQVRARQFRGRRRQARRHGTDHPGCGPRVGAHQATARLQPQGGRRSRWR